MHACLMQELRNRTVARLRGSRVPQPYTSICELVDPDTCLGRVRSKSPTISALLEEAMHTRADVFVPSPTDDIVHKVLREIDGTKSTGVARRSRPRSRIGFDQWFLAIPPQMESHRVSPLPLSPPPTGPSAGRLAAARPTHTSDDRSGSARSTDACTAPK